MTLDLRCYLVTSGTDRHTVETAGLAAGSGAGMVQVRAKTLATRDLLSLVLQVGEAVRRANPETRVVVDDRADVAWAAMRARGNVHGVHLGVEDLPVRDARAMLGPDAIVGYTTGTLDLVRSAEPFADALDYLGAGPFRPTPTKDSGRPPLGWRGTRPWCRRVRCPSSRSGTSRSTTCPPWRRPVSPVWPWCAR